ncbi:very short patch repair endonuclease [Rhizobium ruizarguesonis]|uniref:very short patch repair endonuclease n=1 Tax=Rhizobium ruizarguesonis TaxID=2081791 RepID=UPI001AED6D14|nr:DNA mismatch endonuclease Vsr [Rhizobium ruizarguesonis]
MARIRSKDTKPEMIVRRLVYRMGFRYRLHKQELPGKPDLVFANRRKVIFLHGCFWHRHDSAGCNNGRLPKSRLDYWLPKLEQNVARDTKISNELNALGWGQLVIWECQVKNQNLPTLCEEIRHFLCDEATHSA